MELTALEAARRAQPVPADTLTPADRYQELFVDVQTHKVFDDSKTFVDCAPLKSPEAILAAYREQRGLADFRLVDFVLQHFELPEVPHSDYVADPSRSLAEHIATLWPVLTRQPHQHPRLSSLLPLPYDYVVPGGRFGEIYYWDSYFTLLGLVGHGREDLATCMINNFSELIDTYGHVPNGNRSYYLSRSQPPFYALMVELLDTRNPHIARLYLPRLRREHAYWMDGADWLRPGEQHRRVVRMDDGAVLNRYWDDRDTPREESWLEDMHTAALAPTRCAHQTYRDLRAGAESGWDYSSRWLADPLDLASIRTTAILPVDLNALLYRMERLISALAARIGETGTAIEFRNRAANRLDAINRYFWDAGQGEFRDFDWQLDQIRPDLTAAAVVPLFVGAASAEQARHVAAAMAGKLLDAGGLATTCATSGQQWDRPNGWAPVQWMAVRGLVRYGHGALADRIAHRWVETVRNVYREQHKLVEKYDLREGSGGAGGEYPLQDGFGWTAGVTRRLLDFLPDLEHQVCRPEPAGTPHPMMETSVGHAG